MRPAVPLHPGRLVTLLEEAGLILHQHRIRITQVLDHLGTQVVPDRVGIPANTQPRL